MRSTATAEGAVCEFEVPDRSQSWRGMVNGGVVALMLDEAVGWAGWHAGRPGLTGRLEVRFRRPLRLGERVRVVGRVERGRRTPVYASAFIDRLAGRERIADANPTLVAVPSEVIRQPLP